MILYAIYMNLVIYVIYAKWTYIIDQATTIISWCHVLIIDFNCRLQLITSFLDHPTLLEYFSWLLKTSSPWLSTFVVTHFTIWLKILAQAFCDVILTCDMTLQKNSNPRPATTDWTRNNHKRSKMDVDETSVICPVRCSTHIWIHLNLHWNACSFLGLLFGLYNVPPQSSSLNSCRVYEFPWRAQENVGEQNYKSCVEIEFSVL